MSIRFVVARVALVVLVLAGFAVCGSSANAVLIGPGAGLAGATNADGAGGRTNVAQTFVTLEPGYYEVASFSYNAVNTSGTVQPFLALLTNAAPRQYTPIWAGSAVVPSSTGTVTDIYGGPSNILTLLSPTEVYAGFAMSENAVGFANGGLTDHNGAPALTPVVGVEFPTFTNNDLGRSYAFGINLNFTPFPPVPEPSTFLLGAMGLIGLNAARRKAQRNKMQG